MSTPDPSNFVFRSRGSIYHSTSLRALRLAYLDPVSGRERHCVSLMMVATTLWMKKWFALRVLHAHDIPRRANH